MSIDAKTERDIRIMELVALHDAASRCDCGQECYCARNLEYAERELEKLGVNTTRMYDYRHVTA